jgi:hypothetical protein
MEMIQTTNAKLDHGHATEHVQNGAILVIAVVLLPARLMMKLQMLLPIRFVLAGVKLMPQLLAIPVPASLIIMELLVAVPTTRDLLNAMETALATQMLALTIQQALQRA